jgi:hypothetical protein
MPLSFLAKPSSHPICLMSTFLMEQVISLSMKKKLDFKKNMSEKQGI